MTFLSPWSAVIASAVAVPLLLLLYFLKLRRQRVSMASTLLWRKSFEDLQANAPFQRLRWSALLLLQLLILAALLLAMGDPVLRGGQVSASRMILLIDRSASMNAVIVETADEESRDGPRRTRLDAAKETAADMIEHLGERGQPSQMMVIAFGSSAQVVSAFESNSRALQDAIESIQPTDEQADLEAALDLAGAFAGSAEESDEQPPDVVLLSDGGVGAHGGGGDGPSGFALRAGRFRFVQVIDRLPNDRNQDTAAAVDNIGIGSMGVRRDYEDSSRVLVFARLVNAGSTAVETVATLLVDDQPVAAIRKIVPAASDAGLGEQSISHELDLSGGAVVALRQSRADQLAADDVAAVILPEPWRPRVCVVYPNDGKPDEFLVELLEATEPASLQAISERAYANLDPQRIDSGAMFDLLVFDRVDAARLQGVGSLTVGGTPSGLRAKPQATGGDGNPILSWERQHPLMRNVSLDTIVYAGFGGYELPPGAGAVSLALGPDGPVMAELRVGGVRHVAVGFELIKSNWPLHVSSAVFIQNVVDHLTLSDSGQDGLTIRPGETVTVRRKSDAQEIVIDGPVRSVIPVQPGATVTLPVFHQSGLYSVAGAMPPNDQIAVSVLSDVESDIRPRWRVNVNAESAEARRAGQATPQPLWPWLVAAAFALLVVEWLVYCRRVRG